MRVLWTLGLVTLLLAVGLVVGSDGAELGIVTGSEQGTYYQFGLNLQRLAKPHGIDVRVYPSKGSIENLYAVYQRPATQLGIVQADVLAFVTRLQSDPVLSQVIKKTRMVFPLYNEEVHLLARHGIASFEDLADRRVAVGRTGSGTYLTVRLLFKVSEITPREMVPIDTAEALAELKAGRIDAMFYVAGYPVKLLAEQVTEAEGLTLLPVTHKSVTEFYPQTEIPAQTYRWQATPVSTVAVKAVLVSFDFRHKNCEAVGRLAQLISTNVDWLISNGHPKWKAVELDAPLKGWQQYDCVSKYARKSARARGPRPSENPVMDAIQEVLDRQ